MATQDDLADRAGELILEAEQDYQERKAEQEAFLDAVAEEHEVEVIETPCNIVGDHTVTVRARLDGETMDKIGAFLERLEQTSENGGADLYEASEIADQVAQLLADLVADDGWAKDTFYEAYQRTNLDALGDMLLTAFDALSEERKRRRGTADGFRPESGGA